MNKSKNPAIKFLKTRKNEEQTGTFNYISYEGTLDEDNTAQ